MNFSIARLFLFCFLSLISMLGFATKIKCPLVEELSKLKINRTGVEGFDYSTQEVIFYASFENEWTYPYWNVAILEIRANAGDNLSDIAMEKIKKMQPVSLEPFVDGSYKNPDRPPHYTPVCIYFLPEHPGTIAKAEYIESGELEISRKKHIAQKHHAKRAD